MSDDQDRARLMAIAVLVAVVAAGAGLWFAVADRKDTTLDISGFDMASAPRGPAFSGAPTRPAQSSPAASSLSMIKSEPGLRFGNSPGAVAAAGAGAAAGEAAPQGLNDVARRSGSRVSAYTARFRDRHPIMRVYSKRWLSHPDLKKLDDDYRRDHDLVKFVRGMERSPSFGPLVRGIAADPASHALAMDFVTGLMKETPSELVTAASGLLKSDGAAMGLARSVFSAMGAPPMLLSALSGGQLDETAVEKRVGSVSPGFPQAAGSR